MTGIFALSGYISRGADHQHIQGLHCEYKLKKETHCLHHKLFMNVRP